jgi:ribosomal subunit interface protein
MSPTVKILYRNVDPSPALTERIEEKIAKINGKVSHMTSCQVVVELAHHHHQKGNLYNVRIDLMLPGGELLVSEHPGKDPIMHDKVFAAMNSAFAAIDRQLERFKATQKA